MESYTDIIQQIDKLLVEIRSFNQLVHAKRWMLGRLCFKVFAHGKTTPDGLTMKLFAEARGCAANTLYVPLMVYRSLGDWYERQTEYVPFSIARLAVAHDADDAERLMRIWFELGKPDEAEWKMFLDSAANLSGAQNKPLPGDPDEAERELRREARKKFKRFRRRLKAAADARFFANRYLTPEEATELLGYLGPLMGKRSNLLKIVNPPKDQDTTTGATSEMQAGPTHATPAAVLLATCDG